MRRRRTAPEEHENHERWLVSYADFVTLLFAFFVVMYSVSSVNEGKFRVLSGSLIAAFKDPARSLNPIQVGKLVRSPYTEDPRPLKVPVAMDVSHFGGLGKGDAPLAAKGTDPDAKGGGKATPHPGPDAPAKKGLDPAVEKPGMSGVEAKPIDPRNGDGSDQPGGIEPGAPAPLVRPGARGGDAQAPDAGMAKLGVIATKAEKKMAPLIDQGLVKIRKGKHWLEIEFNTSLLFASGSAQLAPEAVRVLTSITDILKGFPNPVQVEGHTDNLPIRTAAFPSNWELSAARAASVVHLFTKAGIRPSRMVAIGYGEYRSIADNRTPEGRRKNRRVLLVIPATSNARRILDLQRLDGRRASPSSTVSGAIGAGPPAIDPSSSAGTKGLQPQPG